MSVADIYKTGSLQLKRQLFVKRILADNNYESTWQDISHDVISWGILSQSYGDSSLGNYSIAGTTITLRNDHNKYNTPDHLDSLFRGSNGQKGTKIKVQVSAREENGNYVVLKTFYGLWKDTAKTTADGKATVTVMPYLNALKRQFSFNAIETSTTTTAGMIERILKKSISGIRVYDHLFEGATDAEKYKIDNTNAQSIQAPSVEASQSDFEKLATYTTMQGGYFAVDESGAFVFKTSRQEGNSVQWIFSGGVRPSANYGTTIKNIKKETLSNNLINRAVIEYDDEKNVIFSQSFSSGDRQIDDRSFTATYKELSEDEALNVANKIVINNKMIKSVFIVDTPLIMHLNVSDLCLVTMQGSLYDFSPKQPFNIGASPIGGQDVITKRSGAINVREQRCKVIEQKHNLDTLTSKFILEIL